MRLLSLGKQRINLIAQFVEAIGLGRGGPEHGFTIWSHHIPDG